MSFDLDNIRTELEEHMENQPYRVNCSVCGNVLTIQKDIDDDWDLNIDVEPCEKCKEALKRNSS